MAIVTSADFPTNGVSPGFVGYLPTNLEDYGVAMGVAPIAKTKATLGSFVIQRRADALRLHGDGLRTGGGPGNTIEIGQDLATFTCRDYAFRQYVTVDQINDAAATGTGDPVDQAVRSTMAQVVKSLEDDFLAQCFATSKWATDQTTPATKWNATLAGSPISDLATALNTLDGKADGIGKNVLITGMAVFRQLQRHPELKGPSALLDLSGTPLSRAQIAAALGVDDYIVSSLVKTTSREGATEATSLMMGDGALLLRTADVAFDSLPHALALVVQEPLQSVQEVLTLASGKAGNVVVESWLRGTFKLVDTKLGVFIDDCLT